MYEHLKQEENVRARMIIAAEIDDEIKSRSWSIQDFHRACNKEIPGRDGPKRIEKWLSGTHDFKISELIIIKKVLGKDWFDKLNRLVP